MSNWLYLIGSACFALGTILNMLPAQAIEASGGDAKQAPSERTKARSRSDAP